MYIKDVIMDGFKCYSEKTTIKNLDRNFNAITGMNGSGKSNIIDAVIFALDLNSPKYMRVSSLKELINIHRKECSVSIVLNNLDKSSSPSGYEHYDEIIVCRQMDHEGKSKYKLNNHCCTKSTIENLCKSTGITNDFIVMQGHITKILNMKSTELRNMIEETAGTKSYNEEKERSRELLDKKEIKLREAQEHLKKRISPFFKELMKEKKIYEENKEYEISRAKLMEELEGLEKLKSSYENTEKILELEESLKNFCSDKKELFEVENKIKRINEAGLEVDLVDLKTKINEEKMKIEDFSTSSLEKAIEDKEEELKSINIPVISFNKQLLMDREAILSKQLCDNISTDKITELESLKAKESRLSAEIRQAYDNISSFLKNSQELFCRDSEIKNEINLIKKDMKDGDLHSLKQRIGPLRSMLNSLISKVEVDAKKKSELESKIQLLRNKLIYPIIEGVHGTVDELFELRDEKYKEAIYTIIGGRSKYIICENDDIASEILKSSDRKVSCIPLNKIVCNDIKKLKVSGINALSAIKYDKKYERAFNHLFSSFFIFESSQEASRCCFENKVLCITLDGNVYDPKGTLTGGKASYSIDITRRSEIEDLEKSFNEILIPDEDETNKIKIFLNKLNSFNHMAESHEEIENKLSVLEKICDGKIDIKGELDFVRRQIIDATREEAILNKEVHKKSKLESEISDLKARIIKNNKQLSESTRKLNEYQNILREEELRNNSKRVSLRQVEGLELNRKNLIKSTVKAVARINKIYAELPEEIKMKENKGNCEIGEFEDALDELGISPSIFSFKGRRCSKEELNGVIERIELIKEQVSKKRTRNTMDPKSFEVLDKNAATIAELEEKIEQLERDKQGIVSTIEKLNELGHRENKKAFEHVNLNIGKFLKYFLPDADANISSDYEIRVKIGTWKNSLSELSGGQRSLIALCLIFSMLTYRPAPFYMFDEIDSALDLNYTQRMGEVIRGEFGNAQFIIISLKNNMFDNANRIYKVFIQDLKSKICQIK